MKKIITVEKQKKRKLSTSNFLITIVTNSHLENEKLKDFKESIKDIFEDHLLDILSDRRGIQLMPEMFESIKLSYGFEKAPKTGYDHVHIALEIKHHAIIQIEQSKLRRYYEQLLGKKAHINVQVGNNAYEAMKNYALK